MLLVLQKPNGVFGRTVSQGIECPPDLVITGNNSLFILDALPADRNRWNPSISNYEVHLIPQDGKKYIQPLDLFSFRQWKAFARFIHDHVILKDIAVNIFSCDEIIILQSLIYNQFINKKFRKFRVESWKKSGYIDSN